MTRTSKLLSERLRDGTFEFTQYRQALFPKGVGKAPRIISVPTARDRIVLKCMADLLLEAFPSTKAQLPQTCIDEVFHRVSSGKYDGYVKVDVENCFPSVDHQITQRMLKTRVRKGQILELVEKAISTPTVPDRAPRALFRESRGVPQGLAISNVLAELVLQPVDRALSVRPDVSYHRYVDDILILCPLDSAENIFSVCAERLALQGFKAHPISSGSKSSYGPLSSGFQYLGYEFRDDKISVGHASIGRVESALARAFTRYKKTIADSDRDIRFAQAKCLWQVNLIVTGCRYKGASRGWLHYYRQITDLSSLKILDLNVKRFSERFGMPSSFKPKGFLRSYWAIRHPGAGDAQYIPNFDAMTVDDRRDLLAQFGMIAGGRSDREINDVFFSLVDRAVVELERDIGFVS